MKKTLWILSALSAAMLMTGCTSADDLVTVTQQPTATKTTQPTAMPSPESTGMTPGDGMIPSDGVMPGSEGTLTEGMSPDATVMPESTGVTTSAKARRVIEQIEDELERLSEVDDAQVILAGNKAVVALEFDDQYRGGIDDRLSGIVKDRIASVISGIDTVAITADEALMDTIESLGEGIHTASDMNQLQKDVDALIKKIGSIA